MGCGASSGAARVADASVASATAPPLEPAAKGAPSEPPPEPRKDAAEPPAEPASAALLQEPTSAVKLNFRDTSRYYDPESYGAPGLVDDGVRGRLIDGKGIAAECRALIRSEVEAAKADASLEWRPPRLVVVLVGADAASKVYVKQKQKACQEVGIESELLELPVETTPSELLDTVGRLNADNTCDGILVQLPLPTPELQNEQQAVLQAILPDKDVDGFHPYNLGRLTSREPKLRPCTPFGVMHLLWSTGVNPYGLRCVVVGASNHVGRPMMLELLLNGASVQIVHRFSRDLEEHVRNADCVVVACGKAGLVKGEWIRPGAIVIDVGINRLESGKLVGDVDFDVAKERAGWITPVPGGVGPMTVAMLLQNTMTAYHAHRAAKSAAGSAPAPVEPAGHP